MATITLDSGWGTHFVGDFKQHLFGHPYFSLLACAPIIIITINVFLQLIFSRDKHRPPIIFHWFPVIGSAMAFGGNPIQFFAECREKYGNVFTIILLGRRLTVVLGGSGNKFVLGTKATSFNAEDAYKSFTTPVFGKDVGFDVPGDVFMEQRRFLQIGLSTANLRAYVGLIEDEASKYIQKNHAFRALHDDSTEWNIFDANEIMSNLTILTATRTLHGPEVREALDETITGYFNDLGGGLGSIKFLFPHLPLPSYWRRDHAQQELSKFYISIIQKRKAGSSDHSEHDLISTLLDQRYRDGSPLKEHVIAHLMILLLIAGRHSSSATAAWILIHLAANPDVAESLYAEQVTHFGRENNSFRPMAYDECRQLPLMNAVILETLRIHPPVHSMIRYVKEDTTIPAIIATPSSPDKDDLDLHYIVQKGDYVLASPAVSQVDPQIWKDPTLWNPYRWINSNDSATEVGHAYEDEVKKADIMGSESPYQPFGAGRHRCIGQQFANTQIAVIIGIFIRHLQMRVDRIPNHNYYAVITSAMDGSIKYRRRSHPLA